MQDFSHEFPQANDVYYLNHAAVSPWPKRSEETITRFAKENCLKGAANYPEWMETENACRSNLAKLIGLNSTEEIAFAKSTSEALSIIAYGIDWQEGDEIIISNHEFPSNRIVWESLAQYGVTLSVADLDTDDPISAIRKKITPHTRLVSLSSVQYASGIRADLTALGQLCRQNNILLCIDAIQSLGAIPFDQLTVQADFIVADGHKWMMAAEGLALFYVKHAMQDQLKLRQYGWHMVQHRGNYDRQDWQPASDATRFECGSPNMLGAHVLNASLSLIHEIGMPTIYTELNQRIDYLITLLRDKLPQSELISPTSPDQRGGIITFTLPDIDLKTLHGELMKRGVICAHRGGGIRFSPHFYTSQSTLDQAIAITHELIGQ